MKLDHYYKSYLQHNTDLNDIYKNTLNSAYEKTQGIQDNKIEKLEKYLNGVFYAKDTSEANQKKREKIYEALHKAYEKQYNSKLNKDFSLSNSSNSISAAEFPSIAKSMNEAFKHEKYIERQTIKDRLNNLEIYLEEIEQLRESGYFKEIPDKYDKIQSECKELREVLEKIAQLAIGEKRIYLEDNNDDIRQTIADMDKLYHGLSTSYGAVPPQGYGDLLEWALQALTTESNSIAEMSVDDLVNDMLKNVAGSKTVGQDKTDNMGIVIHANELNNTPFIQQAGKDKKTGEENNTINYIIPNPNGGDKPLLSFKYTSGFTYDKKRQGKMDIDFTLPDAEEGHTKFKISAKNWASLKSRDFGSSNLAYTLLRTIGEEGTDLYGYVMSDEEKSEDDIIQAHKVAKLSIVLDILMGYSQSENFANTIVINDRSIGKMRVYSIYKIIKHIDKNIKDINITGYKESVIHTEMSTLRSQLLKTLREGRSDTVRSLFYKYLQSVKVTLMYANLKLDL